MSNSVNETILQSIPLNRKMKRYWIQKYDRITRNCGVSEAIRKMKLLRQTILRYLSDEDRRSNLQSYLTSTGFRNNGYLRMLFEYADTQPHYVLSFLKMYTAPVRQTQSADAAAGDVVRRLGSVSVNDEKSVVLDEWLRVLVAPKSLKESLYFWFLSKRNSAFHKFCTHHSLESWMAYWNKWYSTINKGWKSSCQPDYKPVFPEVYKDFDIDKNDSASYKADLGDLISMHQIEPDPEWGVEPPLSYQQLNFVDDFLDEDVADVLFGVLWGEDFPAQGVFSECTQLSGHYVGHVQHIHKKGGGDELRDIAVPNRFIQGALVPGADRCYNLLRQLPCDATFNQEKFDTKIQNRVNNPNLYQGSVDLSKATDNLPMRWGRQILDVLTDNFKGPIHVKNSILYRGDDECVRKSIDLFYAIARAKWEDEGYLVEWKVGQPLGSLTSFACLGLTHNLLVEALALNQGLGHSPYCILGDDIVIFNKRLRKRYISYLSSRGIPLSLHKSFDGRLSEFAGKTYVKNCVPFHCSDHNTVTYVSLLDYQRSTGIRIPWGNLPSPIRRRLTREVSDLVNRYSKTNDLSNPSQNQIRQLARSSYDLLLSCEVNGLGSRVYPVADTEEWSERAVRYFQYRETDSPVPEARKHTGITIIGDGHPVVLMNTRFADKDGYFQRYRPVVLPDWYRDKFRPCATTAAWTAAVKAVLAV